VAVAAAAAVFGLPGNQASAAASIFAVSPPSQSVDLSAGTVQVQVQVQDASNMAAFQFLLRYDRGVLSDPTASVGPFLGSGGQTPECPNAVVDGQDGAGTILFGCATIGQSQGVSGSGTLATVTFRLAGGSQTSILIERMSLTDALSNSRCPCSAQDGSVTVNGGDPSKDLGLSATPTPVPEPADTPTTTPGQPTATATTPAGATPRTGGPAGNSGGGPATPRGDGTVSGSDSAGSAGSPRSGVLGSTGQAGGATGAPGSGDRRVANLGGGPPQPGSPPYGEIATSLALALSGAGLLVAGGRRVYRRATRDGRRA